MKPKYELLKIVIIGFIVWSCGTQHLVNSSKVNANDSAQVQNNITTQNIDNQNIKQNVVVIQGISIDLNQVSYDRPTIINLKNTDSSDLNSNASNQEGNYRADRIFVSENKQYILLASTKQIPGHESFSSNIEFYNNKGKVLWKTTVDLNVYAGKISQDGKYAHFICDNPYSDEINLISYDRTGKELKIIKGVYNHLYSNSTGDIIYYMINDSKSNIFGCLNYRNNIFWEKSFPDMVVVRAVASVTGDVIVSSDKHLLSYSSTGKIKWDKEFDDIMGDIDISMNGNFFIWLKQDISKLKTFDNMIGKELFRNDSINFNNKIQGFIKVDFIENTEIMYFTQFIGNTTRFIFFDINENFLKEIVLNKCYYNTFKISSYKKNEINIYFDGLLVQTDNYK
jgi:hypothetical protein